MGSGGDVGSGILVELGQVTSTLCLSFIICKIGVSIASTL